MATAANNPILARTHAEPQPGGSHVAPTLLGRSPPRIPIGGRIRAGIKVLTKRAEEFAEARSIYDAGVAAGKSFEAIEREIEKRCPELKNPLTPKNVPYFTVRGEDFPNPELARQIIDMFGEDRGDGVKRLYRFPVVFPADAWQTVMPHELVTWTASERRFWSEYSPDGQTRYCMTHEAVPMDASGRRAIRVFGGRKTVLRQDNAGLCNPESCPEYQSRKCNLSGRFVFFIPGIKSISAFELPTNSFYAMQAAIEKFTTISFMRGGRISGFLDGRRTPFYIGKRLVEVSRIDDEGRACRVAQWLIELEAPVDVTSLLRPDDGLEAVEVRADEAAALLQGRRIDRHGGDHVAEQVIDIVTAQPPSGGTPVRAVSRARSELKSDKATSADAAARGRGSRRDAGPADTGRDIRAMPPLCPAGVDELKSILDAAAALGVDDERFDSYAQKRWGSGWKLAAGGRRRALDDVTSFAGDPTGFQARVRRELEAVP